MRKHTVITIYLTADELERAQKAFKRTNCRTRNAYLKKKIFDQPITIINRNRSLDDFTEIAVKIRRDLLELTATPAMSSLELEKLHALVNQLLTAFNQISQTCTQE